MSSKSWIRFLFIAISTLCLVLSGVSNISLASTAGDIYVAPSGSDRNSGTSSDSPMQTIQSAIDKAQPGDTINLAPGTYLQDFVTKTDGIQNKPITITGSADAVIKGNGKARIIEVNHSNIIINGFTVNGLWGKGNSKIDYRDKLIYVQGKGNNSGVEGLKITNMYFINAGGECLRLRYYAKNNEIANNTIKNCGIYNFKFGGMKNKNGEGIYIGTAPEQLNDGKNPTNTTDESTNNWIHHNKINTQGNECVETKEGSGQNIIESNECTEQKDPNSAGISIRSNNNIVRFNRITKTDGSGIRIGGDTTNDGINNQVIGNNINNTGGGIKFQAKEQQQVCGNIMSNNIGGDSVGSFGSLFSPTENCALIKE